MGKVSCAVNGRRAEDEEPRTDVSMADLVRSAAMGDEGAWETIVTRYNGLLWHMARAYRLSESEAADVVQTTWVHLVKHLGSIRNPEALGSWLVTTARREALRMLRKTSRERPTLAVGDMEEDRHEQCPETQALMAEVNDVLWRCVDRLPLRDRTLLRMLMADPPASYREISVALNMPIGSIGPTRARCLQRLRHSIARAGDLA